MGTVQILGASSATIFCQGFLEPRSSKLGLGVHLLQSSDSSSSYFRRDIIDASMPPNVLRHL